MILRIDTYTVEVANMDEAKTKVQEYAELIGWGKQEYYVDADIDGKKLILLGSGMVDDFTSEPLAISAVASLASMFQLKALEYDDLVQAGINTGDLPDLKGAMFAALESIYNVEIMYIWDEY